MMAEQEPATPTLDQILDVLEEMVRTAHWKGLTSQFPESVRIWAIREAALKAAIAALKGRAPKEH